MLLPAEKDRGLLVFLIWNALPYRRRLAISLGLIAAGLIVQAITLQFLPGLFFLIPAVFLLLVRGHNNRVDFGKFDPASAWEPVPMDKLDQLFDLQRKMTRWDQNALDATNPLGAAILFLWLVPLGLAAALTRGPVQILAWDALILLPLHWFSGARSVMRQPKLMTKARIIRSLLQISESLLSPHKVEILMLLRAGKVPMDIKFKVAVKDQPGGFLGLYGQIILNNVDGKAYPYFYVVLVARKGFGLGDKLDDARAPKPLLKEYKLQADVEVLVLRQRTTKTSGYRTAPPVMRQILAEGIRWAEGLTTG